MILNATVSMPNSSTAATSEATTTAMVETRVSAHEGQVTFISSPATSMSSWCVLG